MMSKESTTKQILYKISRYKDFIRFQTFLLELQMEFHFFVGTMYPTSQLRYKTHGETHLISHKMKPLPAVITATDKDVSCHVIDYYKHSEKYGIYGLKISQISGFHKDFKCGVQDFNCVADSQIIAM